ncbi:MAG: hypothetical protein JWP85_1654 [Rhodoglobus sp.]|nr:hypothetical protein [Rhodoglobus sp.]
MTTRRRLRSWVDVVIALIDRVPGPPWVTYAMLVALSIAVTVGLRVLDRAPIDALVIAFAGLSFTPFAVVDYINRAAKRALADFRPALGELEPEYDELERQLATTSFASGIAGAIIGIGVVTIGNLTVDGAWGVSADNWLGTNIVTIVLQVILNASLVSFLLREVGHSRTIARIHRDATNIRLWNVRPHNAFARVTMLAALAITVPYVTAAAFSALSTENSVIAIVIIIVALGIATLLFVGPLTGMRRRLVREKERQLSETDRAFEVVAASLHKDVDTGDLTSAANLDSVMTALGIERDRLKKVSTWPWSGDTLRAFLTSLGIPILLWFVTGILGRLLFE